MKITIELEVADFPVVPGIAAQIAGEARRLVQHQVHGNECVVVSAVEDDGTDPGEYAVAAED